MNDTELTAWSLAFGVRRSIRYHLHRKKFFERRSFGCIAASIAARGVSPVNLGPWPMSHVKYPLPSSVWHGYTRIGGKPFRCSKTKSRRAVSAAEPVVGANRASLSGLLLMVFSPV